MDLQIHATIPMTQATPLFSDIVARANYAGKTTILTKFGKPVAMVCPIPDDVKSETQRNDP